MEIDTLNNQEKSFLDEGISSDKFTESLLKYYKNSLEIDVVDRFEIDEDYKFSMRKEAENKEIEQIEKEIKHIIEDNNDKANTNSTPYFCCNLTDEKACKAIFKICKEFSMDKKDRFQLEYWR
ncbi:hypothetical protein [Helicobacter sp. 11S02596-1]|uniref:hypothetical protein n=1 Tax=Helicobacter sp. 11S02596-1 TaxID=1476194 RepID=UPI000BA51CEC|nr:hypothetical protein [Helicobacter sp. 11S02596-1]PAF44048.1 hypothetical protein BJI48_04510 [Helicobacter sp. 11S02596-1]